MTRTTPPRRMNIAAVFPELEPLARTAIRLHPRAGEPSAHDSSVGGPLLWPVDEPWPICPGDSPMHPGCVSPLVPVAQLYLRDIPGLPVPPGLDLLQVLWCPCEGEDALPLARLVWRDSSRVGEVLTEVPAPDAEAQDEFLPKACVLHPEEVIEYPAALELDASLRDRITAWATEEGHDPTHDDSAYGWSAFYSDHLSVAPGWKVGGWGNWGVTDPVPFPCDVCEAALVPLLTVDTYERGGEGWLPVEEQEAVAAGAGDELSFPTGVWIGRGWTLQIYICPVSPEHGYAQNDQ